MQSHTDEAEHNKDGTLTDSLSSSSLSSSSSFVATVSGPNTPVQLGSLPTSQSAPTLILDSNSLSERLLEADPNPSDGEESKQIPPASNSNTKQNYLATAGKVIVKGGVSGIAAGITALNALVNRSGKQPKDISVDWWNSMTRTDKALSTVEGVSSFVVNFAFTFFFVEEAWKFLSEDLPHSIRTRQHLGKNLAILLLGIAAAVAASSISYGALSWVEIPTLIFAFTIINVLNTLVSRTAGAKRVINFSKGLADDDVETRHLTISALRRLNKPGLTNDEEKGEKISYETRVTNIVLDAFKPLESKPTVSKSHLIETALFEIFNNLNNLIDQYPDLIIPKTDRQKIGSASIKGLDWAAGSFVALMGFITWNQKGYDGLALMKGSDISDNGWVQGLLGLVPSLPSTMLYFISTFAYRKETVGHFKDAMVNRDMGKFITLVLFQAANYFASSSMENIAQGVDNNKKAIFASLVQGGMVRAHTLGNRMGAFTTNTLSSYKVLNKFKLFTHESTPIEQVVDHLTNLDLSLTEHKEINLRPILNKMKLFHQKANNLEGLKKAADYQAQLEEKSAGTSTLKYTNQ